MFVQLQVNSSSAAFAAYVLYSTLKEVTVTVLGPSGRWWSLVATIPPGREKTRLSAAAQRGWGEQDPTGWCKPRGAAFAKF